MKKIAILLLCLLLTIMSFGCNKEDSQKPIENTEGETQELSFNDFNTKLPAAWQKVEMSEEEEELGYYISFTNGNENDRYFNFAVMYDTDVDFNEEVEFVEMNYEEMAPDYAKKELEVDGYDTVVFECFYEGDTEIHVGEAIIKGPTGVIVISLATETKEEFNTLYEILSQGSFSK